jgi:type VI secretion system protein ImpK
MSLSAASEPVFGRIQSLRLTPPVAPVAQPAQEPRLAQFLQSEIKANLVLVRDEVDRSVITIRGEGLFAGGAATLAPDREALMLRIAEALAKTPGQVLVTGHTDNSPISSARFPSNWHLSEERAKSVQKLLVSGGVAADRIRAEGRADGEPLAPNDTPANKSLNRRVEVALMVGRPAAAPVAVRTAPVAAPAPAAASGARP